MQIQFTNQFLNEYAEQLCLKEFHRQCHCHCYWNHRLRTVGGRFVCRQAINYFTGRLDRSDSKYHIEINERLIRRHSGLLKGTLGHELTHYVCFVSGMPYSDHSQVFHAVLREHHLPAYLTTFDDPKYYAYYCPRCFKITLTRGKLRNPYLCNYCYDGGSRYIVRLLGRFQLKGCYRNYRAMINEFNKLAEQKLDKLYNPFELMN